MILPTIKLKCDNDLGYRIINLDDYDKDVDILFDDVLVVESKNIDAPTTKTRRTKTT